MRIVAVLVFASVAAMPAPAAFAQEGVEVAAAELLSDPQRWNERRVVITGELVGDYSPREDGVWVQLNDDPFVGSPVGAGGLPHTTNLGIGARIPSPVFDRIEGEPGRYGRHGPVVRLEGIFRHADPGLQGETYIAVDAALTVTPSQEYPIPGPDLWLPAGAMLLSVAGLVTWAGRRKRPPSE